MTENKNLVQTTTFTIRNEKDNFDLNSVNTIIEGTGCKGLNVQELGNNRLKITFTFNTHYLYQGSQKDIKHDSERMREDIKILLEMQGFEIEEN